MESNEKYLYKEELIDFFESIIGEDIDFEEEYLKVDTIFKKVFNEIKHKLNFKDIVISFYFDPFKFIDLEEAQFIKNLYYLIYYKKDIFKLSNLYIELKLKEVKDNLKALKSDIDVNKEIEIISLLTKIKSSQKINEYILTKEKIKSYSFLDLEEVKNDIDKNNEIYRILFFNLAKSNSSFNDLNEFNNSFDILKQKNDELNLIDTNLKSAIFHYSYHEYKINNEKINWFEYLRKRRSILENLTFNENNEYFKELIKYLYFKKELNNINLNEINNNFNKVNDFLNELNNRVKTNKATYLLSNIKQELNYNYYFIDNYFKNNGLSNSYEFIKKYNFYEAYKEFSEDKESYKIELDRFIYEEIFNEKVELINDKVDVLDENGEIKETTNVVKVVAKDNITKKDILRKIYRLAKRRYIYIPKEKWKDVEERIYDALVYIQSNLKVRGKNKEKKEEFLDRIDAYIYFFRTNTDEFYRLFKEDYKGKIKSQKYYKKKKKNK